jgi:ABC-type Fe3+ transport system permease subunit
VKKGRYQRKSLVNVHITTKTACYGVTFTAAIYFQRAGFDTVRFLPQAMQSGEASLSLVSPRIDEAARSLGYPPWKVMPSFLI